MGSFLGVSCYVCGAVIVKVSCCLLRCCCEGYCFGGVRCRKRNIVALWCRTRETTVIVMVGGQRI